MIKSDIAGDVRGKIGYVLNIYLLTQRCGTFIQDHPYLWDSTKGATPQTRNSLSRFRPIDLKK